MRINITNTAKIEAEFASVNGKARAFTLTEAQALRAFAEDAEKQLGKVLPKSAWKGARVTCRPAGPSASSYSYGAKSTECILERGATGWFLVACTTAQVYPKASAKCSVALTAVQTLATSFYAARRLEREFTLTLLPETASEEEREVMEADARRLAGVS
ncbi:hypothetical protein DEM26_18610 [Thioclava sp. NG1]|uniref:hypothetical protein n=1 Tax=unclassified Thioclava TaxID=2621713 RepID=UPI000B53C160|nr:MULTISPECIES: hypothetical protein [unclassified Thioclava]OWY10300.1 hypothetical protein B6V72_17650 [Thioclava sp. F34-6]PWE48356.1 hypothetical protein DEM26_18610 [Thioclava sp. NG1]